MSVPILMYHNISPQPNPAFGKYEVTPKAFARQMRWLRLRGYTTIRLDDLLAFRQGEANLPERPVIITFDDGYQNIADYAIPVLQKYGFSAIIYLVTGFTGGSSRWLMAERNLEFPLMDWQTVRMLEKQGFAFGSHTMSHPHLDEVEPQVCRDELSKSRAIMEDKLDRPVVHLAYPYGSYNESVRRLAAEVGYLTACSVRPGRATVGDDLLALPRLPVSGHDNLFDFVWRFRQGQSFGEMLPGRLAQIYARLRRPRKAVLV